MIEEKLREIEERADKATPGPWKYKGPDQFSPHFAHVQTPLERNLHLDAREYRSGAKRGMPVRWEGFGSNLETLKFVAASRTDVPALVRALRIAVERLLQIRCGHKTLGEHPNDPKMFYTTLMEWGDFVRVATEVLAAIETELNGTPKV